MRRPLILLAVLAGAGCAVLSNVTPIGAGAYMTVVRSNDVNARVDEQQAKALAQAAAFCKAHGAADLDVIKQVASAPPPGQPPSAEIDFRCRPKP